MRTKVASWYLLLVSSFLSLTGCGELIPHSTVMNNSDPMDFASIYYKKVNAIPIPLSNHLSTTKENIRRFSFYITISQHVKEGPITALPADYCYSLGGRLDENSKRNQFWCEKKINGKFFPIFFFDAARTTEVLSARYDIDNKTEVKIHYKVAIWTYPKNTSPTDPVWVKFAERSKYESRDKADIRLAKEQKARKQKADKEHAAHLKDVATMMKPSAIGKQVCRQRTDGPDGLYIGYIEGYQNGKIKVNIGQFKAKDAYYNRQRDTFMPHTVWEDPMLWSSCDIH